MLCIGLEEKKITHLFASNEIIMLGVKKDSGPSVRALLQPNYSQSRERNGILAEVA